MARQGGARLYSCEFKTSLVYIQSTRLPGLHSESLSQKREGGRRDYSVIKGTYCSCRKSELTFLVPTSDSSWQLLTPTLGSDNFWINLKKKNLDARGMAQWLTMLAALPEDLSLVPNTHSTWLTIACNTSSRVPDALLWHWHSHTEMNTQPFLRKSQALPVAREARIPPPSSYTWTLQPLPLTLSLHLPCAVRPVVLTLSSSSCRGNPQPWDCLRCCFITFIMLLLLWITV